MIFAHGSRFGGHALFIKDRKLHYVYNFLGIKPEQTFVSPELAAGQIRARHGVHPREGRRIRRVDRQDEALCQRDSRCRRADASAGGQVHSAATDSASATTAATMSAVSTAARSIHRRRDPRRRRRRRRGGVRRSRARSSSSPRPRVVRAGRRGRWHRWLRCEERQRRASKPREGRQGGEVRRPSLSRPHAVACGSRFSGLRGCSPLWSSHYFRLLPGSRSAPVDRCGRCRKNFPKKLSTSL